MGDEVKKSGEAQEVVHGGARKSATRYHEERRCTKGSALWSLEWNAKGVCGVPNGESTPNDGPTYAAVSAEKMKAAFKKLGKPLIPASWMTITKGDLSAVVKPRAAP